MSLSLSVHPCSITALLLGTPQALLPLPQFNLQQDTLAAGTHRGKELLFQGFEAFVASRLPNTLVFEPQHHIHSLQSLGVGVRTGPLALEVCLSKRQRVLWPIS